jgi:hypothetical protein
MYAQPRCARSTPARWRASSRKPVPSAARRTGPDPSHQARLPGAHPSTSRLLGKELAWGASVSWSSFPITSDPPTRSTREIHGAFPDTSENGSARIDGLEASSMTGRTASHTAVDQQCQSGRAAAPRSARRECRSPAEPKRRDADSDVPRQLLGNATSHARPTRPRLPARPGDAALWRRRPDGSPPPLATNP